MSSKDKPQQCQSRLCCKATANLNQQAEEEKLVEDKSLAELLSKKEQNENQDTQG